ncbi:unnamed protein product [Adineta steineri]|uniref:G-protein coupled receptors family 1 profile domain-containing protein n=1 Tax=Adineta steineri TaxID=433720 RepID=A0A815P511_9BILA|nr:unnamed protein product [Adineta steineri]
MLGSIFTYGNNIAAQNNNVALCKIYIYAAYIWATCSPTVLILASIDRLLISSQNVDTRLYSSKRLAYFMISIGVCFWLIFNIHLLVKVNIYQFGPSIYLCSYEPTNEYLNFVFFFLSGIHTLYVIVLFILSIFSFKNVHHIQLIPRQQQKELRTMTKRDFQLLRCLFAEGIVFMIFAMLINGYYFYQAITREQIRTPLQVAVGNFINNLFTFLYNIPYCANFFVFMSLSKAFRHDFKRLIYKVCGKSITAMREENNQINLAAINET